MARQRLLHPDFFSHELLGECHPLTRILFQGLWCHSDRRGVLEDRPKRLKTLILPFDDHDVDAALTVLASKRDSSGVPLIVRYSAGGFRLIWVPKLSKRNSPHPREAPNDFPLPTQEQIDGLTPKPASGAEPVASPEKVLPGPSVLVPVSVPVLVPVSVPPDPGQPQQTTLPSIVPETAASNVDHGAEPARKVGDSPHHRIIAFWDASFRRVTNGKKPTIGGMVGKHVSELLKLHEEDEILARMANYEAFHALGIFPANGPFDWGTFRRRFDSFAVPPKSVHARQKPGAVDTGQVLDMARRQMERVTGGAKTTGPPGDGDGKSIEGQFVVTTNGKPG